ncbi:MAG TPA: hypothetical protein VF865_17535, partial [Acidobacteriaceae bacterium]
PRYPSAATAASPRLARQPVPAAGPSHAPARLARRPVPPLARARTRRELGPGRRGPHLAHWHLRSHINRASSRTTATM